jgi:hypothetical protein
LTCEGVLPVHLVDVDATRDVSAVDVFLGAEVLVVDEGLVAIDFLGQVVLGLLASAGCGVILVLDRDLILFSLDTQIMCRLDLFLLLFQFGDVEHVICVVLIEFNVGVVLLRLVVVFCGEDLLAD